MLSEQMEFISENAQIFFIKLYAKNMWCVARFGTICATHLICRCVFKTLVKTIRLEAVNYFRKKLYLWCYSSILRVSYCYHKPNILKRERIVRRQNPPIPCLTYICVIFLPNQFPVLLGWTIDDCIMYSRNDSLPVCLFVCPSVRLSVWSFSS